MLPVCIALLAAIGVYVSAVMLRKQLRGERGQLSEPSVVMTSRARAAGVPNALLGLGFYIAVLASSAFLTNRLIWEAVFGASLLAAGMSVFLAYSLLFVTRMPCPLCWTGHIINWTLVVLLLLVRP